MDDSLLRCRRVLRGQAAAGSEQRLLSASWRLLKLFREEAMRKYEGSLVLFYLQLATEGQEDLWSIKQPCTGGQNVWILFGPLQHAATS